MSPLTFAGNAAASTDLNDICLRLRELRRKRGCSRIELAARMQLSKDSIRGWENLHVRPALVRLVAWADFFDHYLAVVDFAGEKVLPHRGPASDTHLVNVARIVAGLTYMREQRDMTRADICDLLGMHEHSMIQVERARQSTTPLKLCRYAVAVGCHLALVPVPTTP